MKLLAVAAVCFVAITTTNGLAIGIPHIGRIGMPPFGAGIHPFGFGMRPFGLGIPPIGLGVPLSVGAGLHSQGLVQGGLHGVGNIHSNGYGHDYIGDFDAQRASSAAGAAPATGAAAAGAPSGTAYVPAYMGF